MTKTRRKHYKDQTKFKLAVSLASIWKINFTSYESYLNPGFRIIFGFADTVNSECEIEIRTWSTQRNYVNDPSLSINYKSQVLSDESSNIEIFDGSTVFSERKNLLLSWKKIQTSGFRNLHFSKIFLCDKKLVAFQIRPRSIFNRFIRSFSWN